MDNGSVRGAMDSFGRTNGKLLGGCRCGGAAIPETTKDVEELLHIGPEVEDHGWERGWIGMTAEREAPGDETSDVRAQAAEPGSVGPCW